MTAFFREIVFFMFLVCGWVVQTKKNEKHKAKTEETAWNPKSQGEWELGERQLQSKEKAKPPGRTLHCRPMLPKRGLRIEGLRYIMGGALPRSP